MESRQERPLGHGRGEDLVDSEDYQLGLALKHWLQEQEEIETKEADRVAEMESTTGGYRYLDGSLPEVSYVNGHGILVGQEQATPRASYQASHAQESLTRIVAQGQRKNQKQATVAAVPPRKKCNVQNTDAVGEKDTVEDKHTAKTKNIVKNKDNVESMDNVENEADADLKAQPPHGIIHLAQNAVENQVVDQQSLTSQGDTIAPAATTNQSTDPFRKSTSAQVATTGRGRTIRSAPSPGTNVPADTTFEDYLYKYPNHLYGAGLDPLIERHYTGLAGWKLMDQELLYQTGIKRGAKNNDGNFLHKRLLGRAVQLGEAGLAALWSKSHYTYSRQDKQRTPQIGVAEWLANVRSEAAKDAKTKAAGKSKGPKERNIKAQLKSPLLLPSSGNIGLPITIQPLSIYATVADTSAPTAKPVDRLDRVLGADTDLEVSSQAVAKPTSEPVCKARETARQATRPERRANQKKALTERELATQLAKSAETHGVKALSLAADLASHRDKQHASTAANNSFSSAVYQSDLGNSFSSPVTGLNLLLQSSTPAITNSAPTQMTQKTWVGQIGKTGAAPQSFGIETAMNYAQALPLVQTSPLSSNWETNTAFTGVTTGAGFSTLMSDTHSSNMYSAEAAEAENPYMAFMDMEAMEWTADMEESFTDLLNDAILDGDMNSYTTHAGSHLGAVVNKAIGAVDTNEFGVEPMELDE